MATNFIQISLDILHNNLFSKIFLSHEIKHKNKIELFTDVDFNFSIFCLLKTLYKRIVELIVCSPLKV